MIRRDCLDDRHRGQEIDSEGKQKNRGEVDEVIPDPFAGVGSFQEARSIEDDRLAALFFHWLLLCKNNCREIKEKGKKMIVCKPFHY